MSGELWNGSLVMLDLETKSRWSHILGECMDGPLKGTQLEILPGDTLTWKDWLATHPDTTVLNLRRSSKQFTADFYARPERFALAIAVNHVPYHCTFATMKSEPLQNVTIEQAPLLISFNTASTSFRVFSRRIEGQILEFELNKSGQLVDRQTQSAWDRTSGVASSGPMKGKALAHHPAILTFTHKWRLFHPKSKAISN